MNIYIPTGDITDMQWPCPTGYHVPSIDEWTNLINAWIDLWAWTSTWGSNMSIYLKLPFAWDRLTVSGNIENQWTIWNYWSCSPWEVSWQQRAWRFYISSSTISAWWRVYRVYWYSIRPFKDTPVAPDSWWTALYSDKIYHSSTLWLISIKKWDTWITIADKNLGATTVWNSWNTLSQNNCWYYYQRWNNYWFAWTGSITTSSTQVNASNYWPWNYYSGSSFCTNNLDWSSVRNDNLRWWVTWPISMSEVKNIYIGEYVPPTEYIEYKMTADSSWNLYVPIAWESTGGTQDCPYSWKISVDWWAETTYSWTWSSQWKITLSWYTANSSHTIKIVPTTESYWWARAYCWWNVSWANKLTEIIYDSSYMWYAVSATDTGNYFRYCTYYSCTNLTKPAEEYMPDTVTTIGNSFRRSEYSNCSSLTYAPEEVLPDTVTSIGTLFRDQEFIYCTALTEIKWWKDLSIGNNSYYRRYQFSNITSNKTVKVLWNVWYNSYNQDTLPNSYVTSVSVPSAYLTNFKNTSNYPRTWITDSKFIWY